MGREVITIFFFVVLFVFVDVFFCFVFLWNYFTSCGNVESVFVGDFELGSVGFLVISVFEGFG